MKKTTNLKWFIVGFLFVVILAGVIYLSISSKDSSKSRMKEVSVISKVIAMEQNHDFGLIEMKGGKVNHKFVLKNEGQEKIIIEKVYTSCMCTSANVISQSGKAGPYGMPGHRGLSKEKVEIAPGEEFEVEVVFDPMAHGLSGIGVNQRSVYLETNSESSPKLELKIVAQVTN